MNPLSLALVDVATPACGLVARQKGLDEEVMRFEAAGRPVYRSIGDIPQAA